MAAHRRKRPLVVDLAGPSGSGKSTLAREIILQAVGPVLPDGETAVVDTDGVRLRPTARVVSLVREPLLVLASAVLAWKRTRGGKPYRFFKHLYSIIRLLTRRAVLLRMAEQRRQPLVVFSHELVTPFRERLDDLRVLPKGCLPDLVVLIDVPAHVRLQRVILRDKPIKKGSSQILRGGRRSDRAERIASELLPGFDDVEAAKLLHVWSDRFCSPPLSESERREVLRKAAAARPGHRPEGELLSADGRSPKQVRPRGDVSGGNAIAGIRFAVAVEESPSTSAARILRYLTVNQFGLGVGLDS